MTTSFAFLLASTLPIVQSFSLIPYQPTLLSREQKSFAVRAESSEEAGNVDSSLDDSTGKVDSPQELLLDNSVISQQMARLRSKYPTSESDYLAAARARSAAKAASTERQASDEDWQKARTEAKARGVVTDDGWEASQLEAGNSESQILIPLDETTQEGEDPPEPKLLLF